MPSRPPSLFSNLPAPDPAPAAASSATAGRGPAPNRSGTPAPNSAPAQFITAHCDGGARGNPGPAGFGAQITDTAGNVVAELSEFLGIRTNNYAEYAGLLASLQYALDHGHPALRVISDSELMVKQIQGKYKVNSPDLKPLWQQAKDRIARLDRFEIAHALRHKNKDADRLANEAMDRGMKRGPDQFDRGMKRGPDPTAPSQTYSRANPYPARSTAPPPPTIMDPRQQHPPATPRTPPSSRPERSAVERPLYSSPAVTSLSPAPTAPVPPQPSLLSSRGEAEGSASLPANSYPGQAPTMLRGFARAGVIHILGPHTLPDGTFVKIIPE